MKKAAYFIYYRFHPKSHKTRFRLIFQETEEQVRRISCQLRFDLNIESRIQRSSQVELQNSQVPLLIRHPINVYFLTVYNNGTSSQCPFRATITAFF